MLNNKSLLNKMKRQHRSNNMKFVHVVQRCDNLMQVDNGCNTDQNITNYDMDIVKNIFLF